MTNYGDKEYWEKRYTAADKNSNFDWLENYESLKSIIKNYINKDDKILIIGCGNSGNIIRTIINVI